MQSQSNEDRTLLPGIRGRGGWKWLERGGSAAALVLMMLSVLCGCSTGVGGGAVVGTQPISSVVPSSVGVPNSVVSFGSYEFVAVQGTGQIFTYNVARGLQVQAVAPYTTPCKDPSGMVVTTIGGQDVMAVVCYDTSSLLTLAVHSDGSLSALGSVGGLAVPYPGIVLSGTDVLVPLFGVVGSQNGSVAKVSLAVPAVPAITGRVMLASPGPGMFVNPAYLAESGGYVYVEAGSENDPIDYSSTVQVLQTSTMVLVGRPLVVAHSPQQIAVQGDVAFITLFDAAEVESIDISNPASLKALQIVSLATTKLGCHGIPLAVRSNVMYVGCYQEGTIVVFDVSDATNMRMTQTIPGVASPQRMAFSGSYLLVPSSVSGGRVYQINTAAY